MKILCINYEYPPIGGGGASACKGLLETLVEQGHHVDLVTSGMKGLKKYEVVNGVNIYRVSCIRRYKHYATTVELISQVLPSYNKAVELISRNEYDINHTHFVVPSGLVSYFIKMKTRMPYVLTAHGSDVAGYNPDRFSFMHILIGPLWRMIVRSSSGITAPSKFLKELIQKNIDIPVEVIPNGYHLEVTPDIKRKNRILVVTRMFERKGVQYLLKALQNVDTDWELCVVGDGPYLPVLKKLAEHLDLSVNFLGQVPNEEVASLYLESKIYVFPSTVENFPVVLLEAMAAGCAVITTTASGCAEVVGDAAIKVEPANVEALQQALVSLMGDQEKLEKLGELGQERFKNFTWTKVTKKFEEYFQNYTA